MPRNNKHKMVVIPQSQLWPQAAKPSNLSPPNMQENRPKTGAGPEIRAGPKIKTTTAEDVSGVQGQTNSVKVKSEVPPQVDNNTNVGRNTIKKEPKPSRELGTGVEKSQVPEKGQQQEKPTEQQSLDESVAKESPGSQDLEESGDGTKRLEQDQKSKKTATSARERCPAGCKIVYPYTSIGLLRHLGDYDADSDEVILKHRLMYKEKTRGKECRATRKKHIDADIARLKENMVEAGRERENIVGQEEDRLGNVAIKEKQL